LAVTFNCGDIITSPGTYVLTADINCGTQTQPFGLAVIASNVTLDLSGHSVTATPDPTGSARVQGIYVTNHGGGPADNAVVKNGTVTGFDSGVYFEEVFNGRVQSMNLHDNIGPDNTDTFGEGFQSYLGGGHTVTGSQIVHNGPFAGAVVYGGTSNNTITSNSVRENNILGGHHGSEGDTMQDIGIWVVLSPNTGNTVSGNQVINNGLDGIQLGFKTGPTSVLNNSVTGNGFGQPTANGFRDGDGVAVFGDNNLVQSNSVVSNGAAGIGIHLPPNGNNTSGKNNTVRLNISVLNGGATTPSTPFDLYDQNTSPPCDNNAWILNTFLTRNQTCIH
jgi:hypothetical protein